MRRILTLIGAAVVGTATASVIAELFGAGRAGCSGRGWLWHRRVLAAALVVTGGFARVDASPGSVSLAGGCRDRDLRSVIVTLRSQPPAAAFEGRPAVLERALRRHAERALPARLAGSGRVIRRLWLLNGVALRACPGEVARLARDPAVAAIEPDRKLRVVARRTLSDDPPAPAPFAHGDWGLAAIFAPAVWREYGINGSGVRVGSIDSGVDAGHPDLAGKVSAWRDFINHRPVPYDDNGHGSHTIATMIGGRAEGLPVGVAPGARVIVAKAIDADGSASLSTLIAAAEWMADPDGVPGTDDAPAVINASWGGMGVDRDGALRMVVRRWRQLGIVPVFSAGNSGPEPGSVVVPAVYPEALAVGALDPADAVAPFSSRGARAAAAAPFTDGLRPLGLAATKPDLAAPGVAVRSAQAGGGYVSYSGTSMAAPHVAGVVALVHQAAPRLPPDEVAALLRRTARDVGPAGPDQMTGAGLVDAIAAMRALLGPGHARPGLRLVATPPALTNQPRPGFALDSGGARVQARVDGGPPLASQPGPIVHVPIAGPGHHVVELQALGADGAPVGAPLRRAIDIDRSPPRLHLEVRREGLLRIAFRARADRTREIAAGSLRVRTSDRDTMLRQEGQHLFTERGPYWIEVVAQDRAGNLARLRAKAGWPKGLVARRLAWNRAFLELDLAHWLVRFHRRDDGSYRSSGSLTRLCAGNLEFGRFAPLGRRDAHPPLGTVGVWSARHQVLLVVERGGRRYLLQDTAGHVRRESRLLGRASRKPSPGTIALAHGLGPSTPHQATK